MSGVVRVAWCVKEWATNYHKMADCHRAAENAEFNATPINSEISRAGREQVASGRREGAKAQSWQAVHV